MRKLKWTSRVLVVALLVAGQIGCSTGAAAGGGRTASKSSRDQLVRAQKAIDAKRYAEAIKLCDAVIAAEPDDAEAYKVRGLARLATPMAPSRPPPRETVWNSDRPRYGEEPYWLRRMPAVKDFDKAGELRGHKDPVVWYLRSVAFTDIARNGWQSSRLKDLKAAMEALEKAEALDPKNPAYRRAREVLVPQLYFARRDHASQQMPYNGEHADVVRMGDRQPYGEVMKGLGWTPGQTWLPPAQRPGYRPKAQEPASPASGDPHDDASMYALLAIGAVLLMAGLSNRDGGGGRGGGGGRSGGVETCGSCRGAGQVSDWNHYTGQMTWGPCRSCGGSGVRPK